MPNPNPIQVDKPQVQTFFQIPAANSSEQITLTVKIKLNTAGWKYTISNQIFFDGNDIYPAGTPEPSQLLLGKGSDLNGKPLMLLTKVTLLFPAGGFTGTPPVFTYSFCIDAGANNLESFEASSVSNFVTNFNSQLLFQQL